MVSSSVLARWFGVRAAVSRGEYVVAGVVLFGVRYLLELTVVSSSGGRWLDPATFLLPYFSGAWRFAGAHEGALPYLLAFASLPFLWVGTSMSVRRAVDAGLPAWLGFLFVVPVVHYVVMLVLASWPTAARAASGGARGPYRESKGEGSRVALNAPRASLIARSALIAAAAGQIALHVLVRFVGYEGPALFLVAPLVMGVSSSAAYYLAERAVLKGTPPRAPAPARSSAYWQTAAVLVALAIGGAWLLYGALARFDVALRVGVPAVFVCILAAALGVLTDAPAEKATRAAGR